MSDKIKYGTVDISDDAFKPENTMISMASYKALEAECREYREALERIAALKAEGAGQYRYVSQVEDIARQALSAGRKLAND